MDWLNHLTHSDKISLMNIAVQAICTLLAGLIAGAVMFLLNRRAARHTERSNNLREAYAKWAGLYFEWLSESEAMLYYAVQIQQRDSTIRNLTKDDPKVIALSDGIVKMTEDHGKAITRLYELSNKLNEAEARLFLLENNKSVLSQFFQLKEYPKRQQQISQVGLDEFNEASKNKRLAIKEFCRQLSQRW